MKILAYDSSSEVLSIALFDGERRIGEIDSPLFTRHSATLAPSIDIILKAHKMELQDIDVIAVGLGPGSFTGLRVGIVTAKVLAWTLKKKLVGVSSLEAIAYGAANGGGRVAVMLDAKRDMLYAALYECVKGSLRVLRKPALVKRDAFSRGIGKSVRFVGDGATPRGSDVVKAALPLIKKKKFTDPFKLDPLYLHPKTCNVVIKK